MARYDWQSGVSGDWMDAADWGGSTPDSATADAAIAIAGKYTVSIAASEDILVNAVTLDNAKAVLQVAGLLNLAGDAGGTTDELLLDKGKLKISGTIANGTINAGAGQVQFAKGAALDDVTYLGALVLHNGVDLLISGGLHVDSATAAAPGTIDVTGNKEAITFTDRETLNDVVIHLGATAADLADGIFAAAGTALTLGSGVTIVSIDPDSGDANTLGGGAVVNDGAIDVAVNTLSVTSSLFVNAGVIDIAAGGVLSAKAASFASPGTVDVNGGTFVLGGFASLSALAHVSASAGGLVDLAGTLDLGGGEGLSISGAGGLEVTGTVADGTLLAGDQFSFDSIDYVDPTVDNITYLGNLDLSGFELQLAVEGGLTVESTIAGQPGTINLSGTIVGLAFETAETLNNVVINLGADTAGQAGYLDSDAAPVTIGSTGVVNVFGTPTTPLGSPGTNFFDGSSMALDGHLNIVTGKLDVDVGTFTNNGVIDVATGGLLDLLPFSYAGTGLIEGTGTGVSSILLDNESPVFFLQALTIATFEANAGNTLAFDIFISDPIFTIADDLILNGIGSEVETYDYDATSSNGSTLTLEQTLGTIGEGGMFQVLGGRGFAATQDFLIVDGSLILGGGIFTAPSLSLTSAAARIAGFGTIADAIANAGTIEASGGALDITGAVSGPGVLVIDGAARLELSGAAAETVVFNGAGDAAGTLALDAPAQFTGTLSGLGNGDVIDITTAMVKSATLSGASLLVTLKGGMRRDYALAAPVAGGAVAVTSDNGAGSDIVIEQTGGAAAGVAAVAASARLAHAKMQFMASGAAPAGTGKAEAFAGPQARAGTSDARDVFKNSLHDLGWAAPAFESAPAATLGARAGLHHALAPADGKRLDVLALSLSPVARLDFH